MSQKKVVLSVCRGCGIEYDRKEVKRVYGEHLMDMGYHSAQCYTQNFVMKQETK